MSKYYESEEERKRRFKKEELEHELAGEEECPTCGRHLDDSGHCPRCEKPRTNIRKKDADISPIS